MNDFREYHFLFENTTGDVTLNIRFSGPNKVGRSFPPKQISWKDVMLLFGGPDGAPFSVMKFDEWSFSIKKVEIEPSKGQVTLIIS